MNTILTFLFRILIVVAKGGAHERSVKGVQGASKYKITRTS